MRRLVFAFALLGALALSGAALADDPPEMRAVYCAVFDINTQAKCDAILSRVLGANSKINAVFVEARGRADAYYFPNREDSTYPNPEPRGQLYTISPSNFDPLQYFIDRCHAATPRREVHAWLTTMNSWNSSSPPSSSAHIYNAHPEWITENSAGVTYTYSDDAPLDPGIPAVQDHIYNVFMDVVRNYDIDGIHFDYVRLLGSDSGYDPVAVARFQSETGFAFNPAAQGALSEVYEAWRRDKISQIVQRVHQRTMLEKPWVETSAFLVNLSDSVEVLAQGYNWWVAHEAIDVLHPGCYSSTVSGTQDDWNFYVAKLAQNGDQNKRPLVCAIGDYLLEDAGENAMAVTTLRANSRAPQGFNFFDYGSLYIDGTTRDPVEPADQHAQNLFNTGGPMDDWAPLPAIAHKAALGEETTPPNAPASVSASIVSGFPRVTFSRPAAAADGDLPVHYRLYRSTSTPVSLYYENMIMEWWDLNSARSSFTYDDYSAPSGALYYAVVAYDNWNNEATATAGPVSMPTPAEYIIETQAGMLHPGDFSVISGSFSTSSSHSTAAGCTNPPPNPASPFATPGTAGESRNDICRFTPSGLATGSYNVYVTTYNFASANAQGITVRINGTGGIASSTFNLTAATAGNKWAQVGTIAFAAGQGHYVEFDNSTQTNFGDSTDSRMAPCAVRFLEIMPSGGTPAPKELKPAVSPAESAVTEVIVDSHPQALDYDDLGSASTWADTANYTGYYNANARFWASTNAFPITSYAVWIVDLPREGRWAIDGWIRNNDAFAQNALYRFVDRDGAVHNVTTTQRFPPNSTTSGGWLINVDGVSDGAAYGFNAGRVYVTLYGDSVGSVPVVADALRFRYIGPFSPVEDWPLF